jgi:hypothetical protein
MTIQITRDVAIKVLSVVDAGLVNGLGTPTPGKMCVEAAVCYALGLPHGDDPQCVSKAVRALKIRLNDLSWSSNATRAKGLRRLSIIQLGTLDLDNKEFLAHIKLLFKQDYLAKYKSRYAAYAATADAADAADAAYAAAAADAKDKILSRFAEDIVQILVRMNVESAQYLDLAPL